MELRPYLKFSGTCEEAMSRYREILGGEITLYRYSEAPMEVPENYRNKILHAEFVFDGNTLLACDDFPGQQLTDSGAVSLTLEFKDKEQAENIFVKLADAGTVIMPFEKQFWNTYYGQVTDKFGKSWMVNCPVDQ
ncbi:VOC family protein [Sinomicrobium sp. M5D2P9]